MDKDIRDAVLLILLMCIGFSVLSYSIIYGISTMPKPAAYPVACADIPESNERLIIVRDGQVECHYKITRVKEKKK